ncbi:hypothetical protein [Ralstonia sp. UNC404CL21Col]|uniref:hypothetical protein n=1 Tax=Ralstonia sp. UNC404CL21Col TaxID=1380362 RepID=UPI0012DDD19A|nr:hypothetical protein [Ralstonia sp. UNC404CL21Col]
MRARRAWSQRARNSTVGSSISVRIRELKKFQIRSFCAVTVHKSAHLVRVPSLRLAPMCRQANTGATQVKICTDLSRRVHRFEARCCPSIAFKNPFAVPSFPVKAAWAILQRDGFEDRSTTAAPVFKMLLLQRMHLMHRQMAMAMAVAMALPRS